MPLVATQQRGSPDTRAGPKRRPQGQAATASLLFSDNSGQTSGGNVTVKHNGSDEGEADREDPEYSYPAFKLHQNGHVIYFTTIPIDDLFPYACVERYNENPEEGYQRKYDERRAIEIAEYLSTEGESIPINIVLSAQPAAELSYTRKTKQLSYVRAPEAFTVLDGQHRLWGYQKCKTRHRVPVAIYEGLD